MKENETKLKEISSLLRKLIEIIGEEEQDDASVISETKEEQDDASVISEAKEENQRKPGKNFDRVKTFEGWEHEYLQKINAYALENNLRIVSLSKECVAWEGEPFFECTVVFDRM